MCASLVESRCSFAARVLPHPGGCFGWLLFPSNREVFQTFNQCPRIRLAKQVTCEVNPAPSFPAARGFRLDSRRESEENDTPALPQVQPYTPGSFWFARVLELRLLRTSGNP